MTRRPEDAQRLVGDMSKAFTREDDLLPPPVPARRGSVGPRPLTADGHARLLHERAALEGSDASGAEERRKELDALLERAVPAPADAGADGRAVLGAFLEVEDEDGGQRELRLVGWDEADASRGWVRVDSPLGAALLGRRAGDSVLVERPRDTIELKILRVHAGSGDTG
ncbi:MAG TPA: GreA/GreB family elongation factor [Myxococcaceae bacterium]|nr:GreA/GreB family elongation factor [Myxococcaceae bacterium]